MPAHIPSIGTWLFLCASLLGACGEGPVSSAGGEDGGSTGGEGEGSGAGSGSGSGSDSGEDSGIDDADGDGVPATEDCDDGDATVYPGAPDLCDDQLNDCGDAGWDEDVGLATLWDLETGEAIDLSEALSGSAPAHLAYAGQHRLDLCRGTWSDLIELNGALGIVGHGEREEVILSAQQAGPVVAMQPGAELEATGLTLTEGRASHGGCIQLVHTAPASPEVRGLILLDDVDLLDCVATEDGGALYVDDQAELTIRASRVRGGSAGGAGGGVYAGTGIAAVDLTIEDSVFAENAARGGAGGALYMGARDGTITDTLFTSNTAATTGGAVQVLGNLILTATDSPPDGARPRLTHNTAFGDGGGALWFAGGNDVVSEAYDWGAGDEDNHPEDVGGDALDSTYSYEGIASFVCSTGGSCE